MKPQPARLILEGLSAEPTAPADLVVVGAGPAGLAAAEAATECGASVRIVDQMPSAGRKFLVAGRGGLNLTHSEPLDRFASRFGGGPPGWWRELLSEFGPDEVRNWCRRLGIETYAGTSGRVFPVGNRTAALLRMWIARLRSRGVVFSFGLRLVGIEPGPALWFEGSRGEPAYRLAPKAAVLALGGGSWSATGSDGRWTRFVETAGVSVSPLRPANCGFDVAWSPSFLSAAEGRPLKNIALTYGERTVRGELLVTRHGLEGGAIYQLSGTLREAAPTDIHIDLKPDSDAGQLIVKLRAFRGKGGLLRRARLAWRLSPAAFALLDAQAGAVGTPEALAGVAKRVSLRVLCPRPLEEAISTAGGVMWEQLTSDLMLRRLPGLFVAGEMLDWEAPTGGYLLTGCLATGRLAGRAAAMQAGRVRSGE